MHVLPRPPLDPPLDYKRHDFSIIIYIVFISVSHIRRALNVIRASFSPIFQKSSCYNMHVTGACTRHAPWIQPARDSDSSAREAALRKRRERDRDNRDSSEREARLSRRRHINEIRKFIILIVMNVINRIQTSV